MKEVKRIFMLFCIGFVVINSMLILTELVFENAYNKYFAYKCAFVGALIVYFYGKHKDKR